MLKACLARLLLITALLGLAPLPAFAATPNTNPTEAQAQQHCHNDTVVWVNLRSGIYHFKGERWYGRTKQGAYVCRKEVDQAGEWVTRNGQKGEGKPQSAHGFPKRDCRSIYLPQRYRK